MRAFILIHADRATERTELAARVAALPGVRGAIPVTGPYDVIAETHDGDLSDHLSAVTAIPGVIRALRAPVETEELEDDGLAAHGADPMRSIA